MKVLDHGNQSWHAGRLRELRGQGCPQDGIHHVRRRHAGLRGPQLDGQANRLFGVNGQWHATRHQLPPGWRFRETSFGGKNKADVAEHPKVFDHVGLLVNEPPGTAGLPFS